MNPGDVVQLRLTGRYLTDRRVRRTLHAGNLFRLIRLETDRPAAVVEDGHGFRGPVALTILRLYRTANSAPDPMEPVLPIDEEQS